MMRLAKPTEEGEESCLGAGGTRGIPRDEVLGQEGEEVVDVVNCEGERRA
jgi:hypothetical protein